MRIARVGELQYRNTDGTERTEVVTPEVLFNKDSIDSFKMKPITLLHPPGGRVTPKNARQHARGLTGHTAIIDGDFLGLVSTVLDEEMIEEVISGRTDQTSCGYDAPIRLRSDGKYDQVERLGNHVAGVPHGRAGVEVGFHVDSADEYWLHIRSDRDDADFDESRIKKLLSTETLINRLMNLDEIDRQVSVFVGRAKSDEGTTEQSNQPADNPQPPTPTKAMRQITIGGEVFSIDNDKLADSVLKLQTDSAESDAKATEATKRADTTEAKLEVVTAEKTQLTQKLDAAEKTRLDADQVSTEVSARLDAWSIVLPLLRVDNADYQPDYKLPVADIHKLAIAKKFPEIKLDGKSEDAIAAMWELTAPALNKTARTDSSESLRDLVTIAQNTVHTDAIDAASKKAANAYETAWKQGSDD